MELQYIPPPLLFHFADNNNILVRETCWCHTMSGLSIYSIICRGSWKIIFLTPMTLILKSTPIKTKVQETKKSRREGSPPSSSMLAPARPSKHKTSSFFSFLGHSFLQILGPGVHLGSNCCQALEIYYQATSPLAITLAEYFKVLFPKAYLKLKKAFNDSVWVKDDPGPCLGGCWFGSSRRASTSMTRTKGPTRGKW